MSDLTPERIAELKRIAEGSLLFDADDVTKLVVLTQSDALSLLAALTAERERAEVAEFNLKRCRELRESGDAVSLQHFERANAASAERAALRAQVEKMREAMGEEWEYENFNEHLNLPNPGRYRCRECNAEVSDYDNLVWPKHDSGCSRGRFFAALKEAKT